MTRKCRELLKGNNKKEKMINESNISRYTEMIIYLRGSDIDKYNQELVRADLIEMIIDGQERNDDIKKVMGGNYKDICDEIINNFPKKTIKQKLIDILNVSLSSIWILVGISLIQTIIVNLLQGNKMYSYELSVGNLLNMIIITVMANIIVNYLCKNAFVNLNKNKTLELFKTWIITIIIIGSCITLSYYLDYVIIVVPIIFAISFGVIIFCLERILNSKI